MTTRIHAIASAGHAAGYFEKGDHPDYYGEGNTAPSEWIGRGAEALGLAGQRVEPGRFRDLLEGTIDGNTSVGTMRDGEWQHHPGWDMQFSPDKSVSIAALVNGDERIVAAHDAAVRTALAELERRAAITRVHIRDSGGERWEHVNTGNLAIGVFRHETSRALDPQLHSHAIVTNLTRRDDGRWCSLDSREMYRIQREIGLIYRAELASRLREMGYRIESIQSARGMRDFRIADVPREVVATFSRRSAQIDKELERQGLSRDTATAEQMRDIVRGTRDRKQSLDPAELRAQWRETARSAGIHTPDAAPCAPATPAETTVRSEHASRSEPVPPDWTAARLMAASAEVMWAVRHATEREAVISHEDIVRTALERGLDRGIRVADVERAISAAIRRGDLVERHDDIEARGTGPHYTTPQAQQTERSILAAVDRGRGAVQPIMPARDASREVERASRSATHPWTRDQRAAAKQILSSSDRVIGVQGHAGTAKTSTVLAMVADVAQRLGYSVKGMAPSGHARDALAGGARIDARTIAMHLIRQGNPATADQSSHQIWIVDEASMISARDMDRLLVAAEKVHARVILAGDDRQLGSVEAGRAFGQMQQAGMQTAELAEIVRQTNEHMRQSVYDILARDFAESAANIERAGGKLIEIEHDAEPSDAPAGTWTLAQEYLALPAQERDRTIAIDPGRASRNAANKMIRDGLLRRGELKSNMAATVLDDQQLTREQIRDPATYRDLLDKTREQPGFNGDRHSGVIVEFRRSYQSLGIEKGEAWRVTDADVAAATVTLTHGDRTIQWQPGRPGDKVSVFLERNTGIAVGDQIRITKGDNGLLRTNGQTGVVTAIDAERGTATVRWDKNSKSDSTLYLRDRRDQHWDHSYVQTAHAAQGATSRRVIVNLQSTRTNLVNERSLYVAVSRAKENGTIITDSRKRLLDAVASRSGAKDTALGPRHQEEKSKNIDRSGPAQDEADRAGPPGWTGASGDRHL